LQCQSQIVSENLEIFWLSKLQTDKASMLDEVIEYLKQLQAQVQMMSTARNMPQMMMPLGMQQHLQMTSLLARMGMGVGLGMGVGMLDIANMARSLPQTLPPLIHPVSVAASAPPFVSPFVVPFGLIPTHASTEPKPESGNNASLPLSDPYSAFLAQVRHFNRMIVV
jgi:hypothetical protein